MLEKDDEAAVEAAPLRTRAALLQKHHFPHECRAQGHVLPGVRPTAWYDRSPPWGPEGSIASLRYSRTAGKKQPSPVMRTPQPCDQFPAWCSPRLPRWVISESVPRDLQSKKKRVFFGYRFVITEVFDLSSLLGDVVGRAQAVACVSCFPLSFFDELRLYSAQPWPLTGSALVPQWNRRTSTPIKGDWLKEKLSTHTLLIWSQRGRLQVVD